MWRLLPAAVALAAVTGCSVQYDYGASFEPYVGAGALRRVEPRAGALRLTAELNTGFWSARDEHADDAHVFTRLTMRLDEASAPGRRVGTTQDLRGNGADGSFGRASVWTDTWRAQLPAPDLHRSGVHLLIFEACHADGTSCRRSVVPVCVRGGRVRGEPVRDGTPDAAQFGRDQLWTRTFSCSRPVFGSLSAVSEPREPPPPPQRVPSEPPVLEELSSTDDSRP